MAIVFPELGLQQRHLSPLHILLSGGETPGKESIAPQHLNRFPSFRIDLQAEEDKNKLFSILVTDLDAPSELNPAFREFRLFVGVNATVKDDGSLNFSSEHFLRLSDWPQMPDIVEPDTGRHRICAIVCEQPSGTICQEAFDDRGNLRIWKCKQFIKKYGLVPRSFGHVVCAWGSKADACEADFGGIVAPDETSNQTAAGQW